MRHLNRLRRLNRTASERKALFRGLATAVFKRQRITTTLAKAKEARRVVEQLITLAKKADLSCQRRIFSILGDRSLVKELVTEIAPRFKERVGGYTRIIRLAGRRKGDNAELVILELTEQKVITPPPKKPKKERRPEVAGQKPPQALPEEAPPKKQTPKPARPKEEKRPLVEKGRKGFFDGLKRFLKPKTGT